MFNFDISFDGHKRKKTLDELLAKNRALQVAPLQVVYQDAKPAEDASDWQMAQEERIRNLAVADTIRRQVYEHFGGQSGINLTRTKKGIAVSPMGFVSSTAKCHPYMSDSLQVKRYNIPKKGHLFQTQGRTTKDRQGEFVSKDYKGGISFTCGDQHDEFGGYVKIIQVFIVAYSFLRQYWRCVDLTCVHMCHTVEAFDRGLDLDSFDPYIVRKAATFVHDILVQEHALPKDMMLRSRTKVTRRMDLEEIMSNICALPNSQGVTLSVENVFVCLGRSQRVTESPRVLEDDNTLDLFVGEDHFGEPQSPMLAWPFREVEQNYKPFPRLDVEVVPVPTHEDTIKKAETAETAKTADVPKKKRRRLRKNIPNFLGGYKSRTRL